MPEPATTAAADPCTPTLQPGPENPPAGTTAGAWGISDAAVEATARAIYRSSSGGDTDERWSRLTGLEAAEYRLMAREALTDALPHLVGGCVDNPPAPTRAALERWAERASEMTLDLLAAAGYAITPAKDTSTEVLTWDYRQGPDLAHLGDTLAAMGVHLVEVDTGGDECAIVLSDQPLSPAAAWAAYDARTGASG